MKVDTNQSRQVKRGATMESISSTTLDNGDTMFYVRQLMVIPETGKAGREAGFFLPLMKIESTDTPAGYCTPTIVASVDSMGEGIGTVMFIYSLVVQPLDGRTQIALSAATLDANEVDYDYFCNFTIIGKLI
jgi:hypothetical protein